MTSGENDFGATNEVPSKSNETKTRVITAIAGGVVFLSLVTLGGHIGVSIVAAVLAGAMCWELSQIFYLLPDKKEKRTALIGTTWLFMFVNMLFPKAMLECLVLAFMGLFSYYLATADRHTSELKRHFEEFVFTTFSLVWIVSFTAFLPLIRDGLNGSRWILLFLLIVWVGDTAAYFCGRKYGQKKLYPLISPGKTLEGAAGGLIGSVIASLLFKLIVFKGLGWFGAIVTPLLVGVVSQVGDLCESFFKRAYGLKDSGTILPGHGGFLDRFDGIVYSLPVMYFCVKVFS
ncbi:MAG: phosphatidate cytidylyltransferase [Bdellovibrionota bacterium]